MPYSFQRHIAVEQSLMPFCHLLPHLSRSAPGSQPGLFRFIRWVLLELALSAPHHERGPTPLCWRAVGAAGRCLGAAFGLPAAC